MRKVGHLFICCFSMLVCVSALTVQVTEAASDRSWTREQDVVLEHRHQGLGSIPGMVKGIDVSHHQGRINWRRVAASDIRFAFIRVADGLSTDRHFRHNWRQARINSLTRGAYQFFRPRVDAARQADLLVAKMGGRERGDLPPALDVETRDGVNVRSLVNGINRWIARYRQRSGQRAVIIYTTLRFWRSLGLPRIPGTVLWIAAWQRREADVPSTWSRWLFWQYTDRGRVSGITVPVDLNRFHGDLQALRAFAQIR